MNGEDNFCPGCGQYSLRTLPLNAPPMFYESPCTRYDDLTQEQLAILFKDHPRKDEILAFYKREDEI